MYGRPFESIRNYHPIPLYKPAGFSRSGARGRDVWIGRGFNAHTQANPEGGDAFKGTPGLWERSPARKRAVKEFFIVELSIRRGQPYTGRPLEGLLMPYYRKPKKKPFEQFVSMIEPDRIEEAFERVNTYFTEYHKLSFETPDGVGAVLDELIRQNGEPVRNVLYTLMCDPENSLCKVASDSISTGGVTRLGCWCLCWWRNMPWLRQWRCWLPPW